MSFYYCRICSNIFDSIPEGSTEVSGSHKGGYTLWKFPAGGLHDLRLEKTQAPTPNCKDEMKEIKVSPEPPAPTEPAPEPKSALEPLCEQPLKSFKSFKELKQFLDPPRSTE